VSDDDRALATAVAGRGDERAFMMLYDRHTPALYGLAMRLTGGHEPEAQEIVHDAWIRAAEKLGAFEWRSSLRTWLSSFVVNRWREVARAGARDAGPPIEDLALGGDDERLTGTLDRVDLERAVAALAAGYREVFVLHDIQGYTHDEIATMLGVEPGTSKSQLSRARRELRRALESPGDSRDR
jgi:RNA polymerase sigma-70 factor (ECF subfamily)